MENTLKCDICNVDVHRASYAKHLRNKKHTENQMILPGWKILEPIEIKLKK